MRTHGTFWIGCVANEDQGLSQARAMKGPGYRVTVVRSTPDAPFPGAVKVLCRWELVDQAAADAAWERHNAPMTGLQRQALSYLAEEDGW